MIANNEQPSIQQILHKVIGQKATVVELGHGSCITIDLGPLIEKKGKKNSYMVGQYRLWAYMCAWRIDKDNKPYSASNDSRAIIKSKLQALAGAFITKYEILNDSLDTKFYFDANITLTLFNINTQDEYAKQWMLYIWEENVRNVLVIGPGNSWYYRPASHKEE